MKKIKRLCCLLLALSFALSATALAACQTPNDQAGAPPVDTESALPEQAPTPPETPSQPQPEETPTVPETPPEEPKISYAEYVQCTGNSVNIRSGAGTSFAILGSAEKNTTYAVIGKEGSWYKTYYRGKVAYISASYAAVLSLEKHEDEQVERVIEQGYKNIGVPYVYGAVRLHDGNGNFLSGFTAQKFDCSSLVQYMFYHGAGKLLQVTTRTQVKQGKFVSKSEIQRGDCLFFTNESRQYLTGIERVGHVAVYLGDNYILHTASDYARIEKITAARWKFYIEARRFV